MPVTAEAAMKAMVGSAVRWIEGLSGDGSGRRIAGCLDAPNFGNVNGYF